ncbi:histidine kinase [Phytophthora infestans T30-4]|uniref:Histidine kinase n=1 Tax=Phytophthora infestans (strain T30-4) TaxID=403677 RepID=D0NMV6_PHYIT|nr:histidine kinase [Phytophthora infestans T30-4]EEY61863.1 histidine kinase [Phytophthora infestans T30-4]|eukprot:XP_002899503.1 histidine kinase [Phytophthora infestans T30-4]
MQHHGTTQTAVSSALSVSAKISRIVSPKSTSTSDLLIRLMRLSLVSIQMAASTNGTRRLRRSQAITSRVYWVCR